MTVLFHFYNLLIGKVDIFGQIETTKEIEEKSEKLYWIV